MFTVFQIETLKLLSRSCNTLHAFNTLQRLNKSTVQLKSCFVSFNLRGFSLLKFCKANKYLIKWSFYCEKLRDWRLKVHTNNQTVTLLGFQTIMTYFTYMKPPLLLTGKSMFIMQTVVPLYVTCRRHQHDLMTCSLVSSTKLNYSTCRVRNSSWAHPPCPCPSSHFLLTRAPVRQAGREDTNNSITTWQWH